MDQEKEKNSFQVTDRRFWVEDETLEERAEAPPQKYPSFVEELKARTEAAEQKLRERLERLEEENAAFRERLNSQIEKRVAKEKADFVMPLLEIIDNLERAIDASEDNSSCESLREGVQLNLSLFLSRLRSIGVEVIDNLHQPFDPAEAEAINMVEVTDPALDHKVVAIMQKGYRMGEQILRPAMVGVGRYSAP